MAIEPGLARQSSSGGIIVLVLDRPRIAAMNLPGGMTYRWVDAKMTRIADIARASLVPGHGFRSGALQASIRHSSTGGVGGGVQGFVRATARHAVYYHNGTTGPITSSRPLIRDSRGRILSGAMKLTSGVGPRFATHVSGQRGHPFLTDAMDDVMHSTGIHV